MIKLSSDIHTQEERGREGGKERDRERDREQTNVSLGLHFLIKTPNA